MSWITIDARDKKGRYYAVMMDRDEAPDVGETFTDEGRSLVRVPSAPASKVKKYEGLAITQPRKKDAEKLGYPMFKKYDERTGFGVIESGSGVNEYKAAYNDNPREVEVHFDN